MASKCQASSSKQPDSREKKLKVEEEKDTWSSTLAMLKTASKEKPPATIHRKCDLSRTRDAKVYGDYDCILNLTNICEKEKTDTREDNNENKYCILQLIEQRGEFGVWIHSGRVGEVGRSKPIGWCSEEVAKNAFVKNFRAMTKNSWEDRENFITVTGKYTLIEVEPEVDVTCAGDGDSPEDLTNMPLGKLSKQQIARGFEALEELEAALKKKQPMATRLKELSSRFYSIIPHNSRRARPPTINSPDLLRAKKVMLLELANIEPAQCLRAQKIKEEEEEEKEVAHPLDQDYALLCCQLSLLDPASREYQLIQTYVTQTGHKLRILNIWQVARDGEDERFKAHDLLEHRRLLWHGTNVAVVAAILKSGLRIMPHSGGRVGKGIYFASENSKSAGYVGCTSKKVGIMFLTEVALGKPYRVTRDDPSLCQPPAGYDSVLACGRTEPDPAQDEEVLLDGKKVLVCQGKPIPMPAYKDSSFSQSEYLIYQESQCRIRYLVQLCF